eukprot:3462403-Karenia_brevis.AAC.1
MCIRDSLVGIQCVAIAGRMWYSTTSPESKDADRTQWLETEYCQTPDGLPCLQIDRWDCHRKCETLRYKMCHMGFVID